MTALPHLALERAAAAFAGDVRVDAAATASVPLQLNQILPAGALGAQLALARAALPSVRANPIILAAPPSAASLFASALPQPAAPAQQLAWALSLPGQLREPALAAHAPQFVVLAAANASSFAAAPQAAVRAAPPPPAPAVAARDSSTLVSSAATVPSSRADVGDRLTCSLCGRRFASATGLANHSRVHAGPTPRCQCTTCGRWYRSASELARHEQVHGRAQPVVCRLCGELVPSRRDLAHHRAEKHTVLFKPAAPAPRIEVIAEVQQPPRAPPTPPPLDSKAPGDGHSCGSPPDPVSAFLN